MADRVFASTSFIFLGLKKGIILSFGSSNHNKIKYHYEAKLCTGHFCVCMLLDSRDKSLNEFQCVNVFRLHKISIYSAGKYLIRKFCRHIDFVADSATSEYW